MRVPAREDHPRVEHPNFYWLQEDRLKAAHEASGLQFTILRPQLIVGPNQGVVMNLPPVIGAYAALRRAEGQPFSFPGGADWVWEAVDVRLVADACVWAAGHPNAVNQTFNLTNGEVFLWRDLWPALADVLDIDTGPDEPLDLATYFSDRIDAWQSLAATHGLIEPNLMRLLGSRTTTPISVLLTARSPVRHRHSLAPSKSNKPASLIPTTPRPPFATGCPCSATGGLFPKNLHCPHESDLRH